MLDKTTIYIPTMGRIDEQTTLRVLPNEVRRHVVVACPPNEVDLLKARWGESVCDVRIINGRHIGFVRQRCIEDSPSDYIIFVDDRLDFHVRAKSEKGIATKYPLKVLTDTHFTEKTRAQHVTDMFTWMAEQLFTDKYGMVGVSRRSSNNQRHGEGAQPEAVYNERICSFWGLNRKLYNQLDGTPKFSDMMLKSDLYITLHFLTNGIPTISTHKYAYGRKGGANSRGGCSVYRDSKRLTESARLLKQHFPPFVTLSNKGTKSWKGDFGDITVDVIVHYKRAYEYGISKNKQKGFF